jgi:predicted transcriptional regulator
MTAKEIKKTLARKAIAEAGLTQVQIAKLMGLTQPYVAKIMQGKAPLERILSLAYCCGFEIAFELKKKAVD